MPWILGVATIVLIAALACAFVRSARAIRRDVDERFERIRVQLEHEAAAVVDHIQEPDRNRLT